LRVTALRDNTPKRGVRPERCGLAVGTVMCSGVSHCEW
jgi:hypothetical protein